MDLEIVRERDRQGGRRMSSKSKIVKARQKKWKLKFLEALAKDGVVYKACKKAGISVTSAYEHRDMDEAFAEGWINALDVSNEKLMVEARRRALGFRKNIYFKGKKCGTVKQYSDMLLALLLKAAYPDTFAERKKLEVKGKMIVWDEPVASKDKQNITAEDMKLPDQSE